MQSRSILAVAGIAVAVVGLGAFAPGASAATDTGGNAFEANVAAYKAAYPKLSDARARAAAAGADARRAVYDAAGADAATFGGAWFDASTGTVNIAATTDAALSRAAALGRQYAVAVKPYKVKRSAAALEAGAAELRAGRDELAKTAAGNVGIDVKTNEVVVALPSDRKAALAGKAASRGAKVVSASSARPELDAGCTSRAACDWTLRAGSIMWRGTVAAPTPWCSIGFTARNSSNTRFVYTAGHCTVGLGTNWGIGGQDIGPMTAAMDSGAVDAGIIQVTNTWFTGDTGGEIYISGSTGGWAPVKGVAPSVTYMVAGETVCLSANYTQPDVWGNSCGVLGTNSDPGVGGMARVDGIDACGGDSGGGWYWATSTGNRYAYGIHSRSDFGCHGDGGGTHSWYTPIALAKSGFQPTLNVEIRP